MRIKFNFSKNISEVPIHNQALMNSYIHKCLGRNNEYHDAKSNYNISHLYGGKLNRDNGMLAFDKGGYFVVSSQDNEFINKLLMGVLNHQDLFHGMKFAGVDHIKENFVNGWNYFATLSPFIVKRYASMKDYSFITLNDENFEGELQRYLINKLSKIDAKLDLSDFEVKIPKNDNHKIKKILVKNVINMANSCHINIHTNKRVAELLYNIGLGQSTGSGFGTIYKTENHHLYL